MVETVACPSCTKPIAVSVVKAGQKRCHHCGARLPEPAKPSGAQAPAALPRPPIDADSAAGSSPYWQAPPQLILGKAKSKAKQDVDSAGNMLPERPRSNRPPGVAEERPVLLKSVAKAAPAAPKAPTAPKAPAPSDSMPLASLADAVDRSSSANRGLAAVKAADTGRSAPSASATGHRSVRGAGSNWAVALGLVFGFTITLGLVLFFLFLRSR